MPTQEELVMRARKTLFKKSATAKTKKQSALSTVTTELLAFPTKSFIIHMLEHIRQNAILKNRQHRALLNISTNLLKLTQIIPPLTYTTTLKTSMHETAMYTQILVLIGRICDSLTHEERKNMANQLQKHLHFKHLSNKTKKKDRKTNETL
jgi:hypothetical protein